MTIDCKFKLPYGDPIPTLSDLPWVTPLILAIQRISTAHYLTGDLEPRLNLFTNLGSYYPSKNRIINKKVKLQVTSLNCSQANGGTKPGTGDDISWKRSKLLWPGMKDKLQKVNIFQNLIQLFFFHFKLDERNESRMSFFRTSDVSMRSRRWTWPRGTSPSTRQSSCPTSRGTSTSRTLTSLGGSTRSHSRVSYIVYESSNLLMHNWWSLTASLLFTNIVFMFLTIYLKREYLLFKKIVFGY